MSLKGTRRAVDSTFCCWNIRCNSKCVRGFFSVSGNNLSRTKHEIKPRIVFDKVARIGIDTMRVYFLNKSYRSNMTSLLSPLFCILHSIASILFQRWECKCSKPTRRYSITLSRLSRVPGHRHNPDTVRGRSFSEKWSEQNSITRGSESATFICSSSSRFLYGKHRYFNLTIFHFHGFVQIRFNL